MGNPESQSSLKDLLLGVLLSASRHEYAAEIAATSDEDIRIMFYATAVHEAGHAVVAVKLSVEIISADIIPRYTEHLIMGRVVMAPLELFTLKGKGELAVMPLLAALIAGVLAEGRINDRVIEENGYKYDLETMDLITLAAIGGWGGPPEEVIDHAQSERLEAQHKAMHLADGILYKNKCSVLRVADALMEKRFLTEGEIVTVVRQCEAEGQ